jgi:hypothetical protein
MNNAANQLNRLNGARISMIIIVALYVTMNARNVQMETVATTGAMNPITANLPRPDVAGINCSENNNL